jgi:hypothetical protein
MPIQLAFEVPKDELLFIRPDSKIAVLALLSVLSKKSIRGWISLNAKAGPPLLFKKVCVRVYSVIGTKLHKGPSPR